MPTRKTRDRLCAVAAVALSGVLASAFFLAVAPPGWALAGTLYVDQNNPGCSDTGSGTQSQPFCTITAGATQAVAGQTVQVASGTYVEAPSVARSGTATAPITLTAAPQAAVTITGGTNGIKVSSRSWVVIKGFTITQTGGAGVYVSYSSNITLQDVTVTRTPGGNGIYVTQSSAVTLSGNHVSYAGRPVSGGTWPGITLNGTTKSLVAGNQSDNNSDAGIALVNGSTAVEVRNNVTFANARQFTRAAPGIDVRSGGNTVDGNLSYRNEDSGIQFYNAGGSVVTNNVAYDNGDHGIDGLNSPNQRIIGNTVFGNATSGINLEGTAGTAASSGGTLANNISSDNAVNSVGTKGNIRVDPNSVSGTTLDYDVVHLHTSGTLVTWGNTRYSSLSALQSATGMEADGLQADPLFRYPEIGDFRLAEGSPALDSANSAAPDQPVADTDGNARVDDPAVANAGAGPIPYADRGAYEFQLPPPGDSAPTAELTIATTATAPFTVTADASGSTDGDDTPIQSYRFDFGDGTQVVQGTDPTASHTYQCPQSGTLTISVSVVDTAGLAGTATAQITVPPGNLVCNAGFETGTSGWAAGGAGVTVSRVAGGHSGAYSAAVANTGSAVVANCTLRDAAPHWIATTGAASYAGTLWVRADTAGALVKLRFREYALSGGTFLGSQTTSITLSTAWQRIAVGYTPAAPGNSYLEYSAYTVNTPPGTCFYADDASITTQ